MFQIRAMGFLFGLAVLANVLSFGIANAEAPVRPNIIWLSCEDISPHIGCFGDVHAITPNLDRLAESSVRYPNTFTTAGVCAPVRSAIISGVYQSTLGTHHMRCNAQLPDFIKPFPSYLKDAGYYCTNNSKQDYQFKTPKDVWDKSSKKAHWKNRPDKSKPFFAVFNFHGCHESGINDQNKYESVTAQLTDSQRQDPAKLELPPYYPDTPTVREDWKRNYELITAADAWAGELIQELKEEGVFENTIIMVWSDHGVGLPRAKRWLYDSGTKVPLIVRMPESTADALQDLGFQQRGTINEELISSLDFAPTVLKLAGLRIPEHFQGRAFLGHDLSPKRKYIFGARDRMDERYDIIRAVRDKRFRYIRNYEPFKPYYQFMNTPEQGATMREIRRVHAEGALPAAAELFLAASKPAEELYDLVADPHEVNNLVADPQFASDLNRLRKTHLDWVVETRDIGLIPESEIVRREQVTKNRYSILLDVEQSLIGRIRNVANLATGDGSDFSPLEKALSDEDSVVRYWAAIGAGNMPDRAAAAQVRLEELLSDEAPCVRNAAARALLKLGQTDRALEQLKQELAGEHQWARLRAAIVIDEAGEVARPLIPQLKACLENQPNKYITRVANRTLNVLLGTNNKVK